MKFDKFNSAGFLANHMARLFAQGLQARIKPLGLAPAQFAVLLELWEKDSLTQKQLTSLLNVEQATMANTLNRMERDGLITKKPVEEDRRSYYVCLTQKATDIKLAAVGEAKKQNEQALSGFSDEENRAFIALMKKAIAAMQTA